MHVQDFVDELVGDEIGQWSRSSSRDAATSQRLSQTKATLRILRLLHVVDDQRALLNSVENEGWGGGGKRKERTGLREGRLQIRHSFTPVNRWGAGRRKVRGGTVKEREDSKFDIRPNR